MQVVAQQEVEHCGIEQSGQMLLRAGIMPTSSRTLAHCGSELCICGIEEEPALGINCIELGVDVATQLPRVLQRSQVCCRCMHCWGSQADASLCH